MNRISREGKTLIKKDRKRDKEREGEKKRERKR